MYTRQQWANALAESLGNTSPDSKIVEFIVAWSKLETETGEGALYNLLNTTMPEPGATNFNSVGVKNYPSFDIGIHANCSALLNGLYNELVQLLQGKLQLDTSSYAAIQKDLNMWVTGSYTGHAYNVETLVSIMGTGLDDEMPGDATPKEPPIPENWTRFLPTLRYPTGISASWLQRQIQYGSPLTEELVVDETKVQFFEKADCFWIAGKPHWRIYP